jgi:4-carboxymuconolactone decarboxylase
MPNNSQAQAKARLENPDAFGTFGRFTETPVAQMPPEMREAFDYTKHLRGLVPGPHKIWAANPALLTTIAPVGAYYQTASTLSKAEIEIATCVICGRWGAAYSSFEHEKIGVVLGKLDPAKVDALIAGLPADFDDPRQQIVYELSSALAAARVVPQGLFGRARELLGDAGIADVTVLMGWFTAVSLTLMAYDVPSNATGLDQ